VLVCRERYNEPGGGVLNPLPNPRLLAERFVPLGDSLPKPDTFWRRRPGEHELEGEETERDGKRRKEAAKCDVESRTYPLWVTGLADLRPSVRSMQTDDRIPMGNVPALPSEILAKFQVLVYITNDRSYSHPGVSSSPTPFIARERTGRGIGGDEPR